MEPLSKDWCSLRSEGLERVQQRSEHRLDLHSRKLDELSAAAIQLSGAVERVSQLLEKQDKRIDRLENRSTLSFLERPSGRLLMKFLGVALLILISAGVGVNIIQIIKEVLA